jgi:hypothetical protein
MLLAVSAFVAGSPDRSTCVVFAVGYHAGLPWLSGSTVGQALLRLQLRRTDGRRYEMTRWGLVWSLARLTVGLSLGVVTAPIALGLRRPRFLHDDLFRSRVVVSDRVGGPLPRLRALARRVEDNLETLHVGGAVTGLFLRLLDLVATVAGYLQLLRRARRWVASLIARRSAPRPADPAPSRPARSRLGLLAMLLVIVLVAASFPWGRSSELTVMRQSEDSQPGAPFTGPPSSATGPATAPSTAPADGFPAGTGGNPPPKAQTVPGGPHRGQPPAPRRAGAAATRRQPRRQQCRPP